MTPLPVKRLLLLMLLLIPSEIFSKKKISVRSYSPVTIHSSRLTESSGAVKECFIDADFRNFHSYGIWIIFGTPADLLKKGKLIFKGEGPVRFSFNNSGSGYRSITLIDERGKGFRGIYLEPGAKVRIKKFSFTLMEYPGAVRIITARELKVNGEMSLEKWMAGLNKGEKASVESIRLTSERVKTVETTDAKGWIYLIKKD
jgi:hypothetical protein